ncbi:hypothetical protein Bca101_100901 [Brassica carinata]
MLSGPKDGELCLAGEARETLVEAMAIWRANRSSDLGRGGCFVEPSHGIESSKWAIFGKQNWRCGMNRKPGYGAQLRANLEPTKGVGRLRQQGGGHGSRNPLRRGAAVAAKPRSASPAERPSVQILVVVANIQMRTLKAKRERFHVSGTCTWPAHPGSGSAEVGSSGWKSTARRVVSGAFRPLKIRRTECAHAGRTHNASGLQGEQPLVDGTISNPSTVGGLLEPLTWRADRLVSAGADWERLFRELSRASNSQLRTGADKGIRLALNVKVKKFFEARVIGGSNYDSLKRNHCQGSGLGRISGKEDPVELDSSPTL